MDDKNINKLAEKLFNGTINAQELQLLEEWYETYENWELEIDSDLNEEVLKERLFQAISEKAQDLDNPSYKHHFPLLRISAASIVLIMLSIGAWLYFGKKESPTYVARDIAPGKNVATLTLASGRKIVLSGAANGQLAEESGVRITKTADGQLLYTVRDAGPQSTPSLYNTIETPLGGQYQVILPDLTKVWLNAASSIKYPSTFAGQGQRTVVLKGEAYFEVSKDKKHPFTVMTKQQKVEVLGTHFNINSYDDEPFVKTTLKEGSIRVSSTQSGKALVIKPGQQSILNINGDLAVANVDVSNDLAWKNGEFVFNGQDFETSMRMISRWYNVEVVYNWIPGNMNFEGEVSRSRNLSAVLKMLEATGEIKFKIEGRRITLVN